LNPIAAVVTLALLSALSGGWSLQAAAAQDARCASDYSRLAPNGEYIFVMLAREEVSLDNPAGCVRPDEEIRGRYDTSGLYTVDSTGQPMWEVDWYAPAVTVSGDGSHLVRWGPLAPEGDYSVLALAFYDSGREITRYSVDRLVSFPFMLPVIEGHYTWVHDFELHEESGRLTLATELGEHFAFDVATGQPLSNWVPPVPRYLVASGAVLTLLLSIPALAFALWRRPDVPHIEPMLRRRPG
jgi:outer membrane protein assembly factor BamB